MGSSYHAAGGDVYNVAKIILHPNYDYFELRNDACILVLEQTPLTPCKSLWLNLKLSFSERGYFAPIILL